MVMVSRNQLLRVIPVLFSILIPSGFLAPAIQAERVAHGRTVFLTRCAVCHGERGDGHSKLATMMQPPPFNLTRSRLNDQEREHIVRKGGAAVGRSPNMPNWEIELSDTDIKAVVAYVGTLRSQQTTP